MIAGAEVKQKAATTQDALDIAEGVAAAGATKALLFALDPAQEPLDDERLASRADAQCGVTLEIVYGVRQLLRFAIFSSEVSRGHVLSRFPAAMARFLAGLGASTEARERWKAAADRWTGDDGS